MTADRLIRISTAATVVGIGGVAAWVSYSHVYDVAARHGEHGATAVALPATVDGLVFVASMVLLDSARRGQRAPRLAKVALGLGIVATLAANVAHGAAHGPVGAIVSAWPAVCLVVVVELLMGLIRRGQEQQDRSEPALNLAPVAAFWNGGMEHRRAAEETVVPAVPEPEVPAPAVPDVHLDRARQVFADDIANGAVPSIRKIKEALRIGQDRARRVRAYLASLAVPDST